MQNVKTQLIGLAELAQRLMQSGPGCAIVIPPGGVDVVALFTTASGSEVVCADGNGGLDLWRDGQPVQFGVSVEDAAQTLAAEYAQLRD